MFRIAVCVSTIIALIATTLPVRAAEFGTRDEAVAMVQRVQSMFKTKGAEATFRAVTAKVREFNDRDLYPFIYNLNGVNVAHGAKPELVGKDLVDFRDQNGGFLIREMIDVANGPGNGWVDYRWTNPKTNAVEDKSAYIEKMGQYFVGVGIYSSDQINDNTVAIISGSPNSDDTSLQIAYDLAAVLGDGDNLRILPVVGIGGPRNIRDVRALKGIDLGITQTNILNNFRGSNRQLGSDDNRIVYITKLFLEEMHLIARSDITSLQQLQGVKVNLDEKGSGTSYTVRDVFKRLNIKIEEVRMTQAEAFVKLARGEIGATVLMAGKPAKLMKSLPPGLHFLPVPYSASMGEDYFPTRFTSEDYPEIVPAGQGVDTIAVGTVLIAYNWPKNTDRYRRVEKFVNAFFPRIGDFRDPPRHVKWREVSLTANLPGWTRFEPAETWLNTNNGSQASALKQQAQFETFLSSRGVPRDDQQRRRLYEGFLKWSTREKVRPTGPD
jgi:uncharacterized protein